MNKPTTFIFIGRSGCGKGTQAKLLQDFLEKNDKRYVLYVYGGEQMRKFIEESDSYTAKLAKEVMMAGKRQPDLFAIWCLSDAIVEKLEENMHLIIDGYPRTLTEAKVLDEALEFYKREDAKPILLDVSYDWAFNRLIERKRFDDTEERIKNRLNYFDKDVQPAIDFYERESGNKLVRVNGEQAIEKVHGDLMKAVGLS